ncbi:MAG: ABC transporter permease [Streptosporangiaceae bacterium]
MTKSPHAAEVPAAPEHSPRPAPGGQPSRATAGWPDLGRRLAGRFAGASETWLLLALVILIVVFTVKAPGKFLTLTDFSLMGQDAAWLLVMAVGETFVIITGGIDLSVGSLLVLAGVMTDLYCIHHGGANASWAAIVVGCLVGLATACAWGALQGFLVAKGKVPPLIVTLAGFIAAGEGVAYLITGGADFRTVPNRLVNTIGLGSVLGVPWLIVISFAIAIVGGLFLAVTRFGRYTYAIGSNPEAARRAGIGVDRHLIKIYALSGLLAGVGGILSLASFDSTTIAGHAFDNLEVITAVALGGASLFGGRGSMVGSFIGLAFSTVLLEGLVIIGVNQYWQEVAIGAALVAAVYLDQFRRRQRGSGRMRLAALWQLGRQRG